jgi:hypothetical protein
MHREYNIAEAPVHTKQPRRQSDSGGATGTTTGDNQM